MLFSIDATRVYFNGTSGTTSTLESVPIGGGLTTTIATSATTTLAGLAVDPLYVYLRVSTSTDDSVPSNLAEVPIGGGVIKTLATGLSYDSEVVVSGGYIYFTDPTGGRVLRVPR